MARTGHSNIVHVRYSAIARQGVPHSYSREVAAAFGYADESLDMVPDSSNMGLSCGNPIALANLKQVR